MPGIEHKISAELAAENESLSVWPLYTELARAYSGQPAADSGSVADEEADGDASDEPIQKDRKEAVIGCAEGCSSLTAAPSLLTH